ncbi:hypothetical protein Syun_003180 [Stephania yunnanensis]|uniref:Aminomethyltransferase C-terminal domain-containing protein n=1 Tax=Stephania yunnanensis TaxID=152371 RepID=A0AAP0PZZ5_9MAGN
MAAPPHSSAASLSPSLFTTTWKNPLPLPLSFPSQTLRSRAAAPTVITVAATATFAAAAAAASPFEFDLAPPPIDHDLLETMVDLGAEVSEDGVVESFGNDEEAIAAAADGGVVVWQDCLGHWGMPRPIAPEPVSGEDRIQFLHNQSTANFEHLHEGQGCDTVFVTPTARTIDIAHAWVMVMEDVNLGSIVGKPYGTHQHYSVNGMPITVGVGSILSEDGFSLLLSPAVAGSVWKRLLSLGAIPMGVSAWERYRILQGRPTPGKELTNEFNVLEAGLWNAVSIDKGQFDPNGKVLLKRSFHCLGQVLAFKRGLDIDMSNVIRRLPLCMAISSYMRSFSGCYKGQETISRLITYDGVKQRLWGIHLSAPVEPGSPITVDGKKVGKLTSYAQGRKESDHFGLGYIKRQAASAGSVVHIGDVKGTVVDVPFLARQSPLTRVSSPKQD